MILQNFKPPARVTAVLNFHRVFTVTVTVPASGSVSDSESRAGPGNLTGTRHDGHEEEDSNRPTRASRELSAAPPAMEAPRWPSAWDTRGHRRRRAPALCVGRRLRRLRARRLIVAVRRPHYRRGARYSLWKRRTPGRPARAHSRALEFATVGVLGGRSRERAENVLPNHELLLLGRAVRSRSAAGARKRDATAQTAAQRGSAVT